jgi:phytoene synthase
LPRVCLEVARAAERRFVEAGEALRTLPRRQMTPARIIEAIYHRLLAKLVAQGFRQLEPKVRLTKGEKLRIALAKVLW